MVKAILVIDEMPKNCYDCPCWQSMKSYRTLDGQVFHNWCKAFLDPKSDDTGCKGMMTDEEVKTKPSWCPLRPLPEKMVVEHRWFTEDYAEGFNACLKDILGET